MTMEVLGITEAVAAGPGGAGRCSGGLEPTMSGSPSILMSDNSLSSPVRAGGAAAGHDVRRSSSETSFRK